MQPGYILRNRYRIDRALAAGGFGETYLAIDLDYPGQRQVVVKHLKPAQQDPDTLRLAARLFESEAQALAEIGETSDRIPMLYAYFEEQGQFYLVQEFIAGVSLTQELGAQPLSEAQTLLILQEILVGLKVVHGKNKIHRDLKPDNIIRRTIDQKLVLIDFGAVKEVRQAAIGNPNPTLSVSIGIGTQGYMPTEQALGFPRLASDIYAVGAIGIQCLTGQHPAALFDDDILALRWRHLCPVNPELANLLNKMVAQRHADRYGDALEVGEVIEQLIAAQNPPRSQPTAPPAIPTIPQKTVVVQLLPNANSTPVKTPAVAAAGPAGLINPSRRKIFKLIGFGGFGISSSILLAWLFTRITAPKFSKVQFASVRLNPAGKVVDRPQSVAEIFKEDLGSGVFLTMVKIPAGRFMMGSKNTEKERASDEGPQHEVKVREFYLGRSLVTQAQWQSIMGNNPSKFKGDNNLPVDSVSWLDAMDFCEKLSKKTSRTYRLSSESEWEYACRAGTTTPFAFGEIISPAIVNFDGSYTSAGENRQKSTVVGSFPPNSFGLYDMHGNLWEWCLDEYVNSYRNTPVDGNPSGDIKTRNPNKSRLLRGGSWSNTARNCRSTHRNWGAAAIKYINIGFRVVMS
jgi:eukaryotic-like serine/threonine-protein kinase